MPWTIDHAAADLDLPKLNRPILIEGLPGIGNVGKVAVDFIVDELKAKRLLSLTSYHMPHSVFVNEDNLIELPQITLFYVKRKGKANDLLLLTGDVQPIDEVSCYEFSDLLLDQFQRLGGSDIITLGGIGLQEEPKEPKVYCTGTTAEAIGRYQKDSGMAANLYGIVGPIVGVSGLLLGLAGRRSIAGVSMLAETFGHPMYLGVKGARGILQVLNAKLELGLDLEQLDKEIEELETKVMGKVDEGAGLAKGRLHRIESRLIKDSTNYIG
ncbi:PAC2 family protein [Candidatus Woesearchaeota archaeon]|nr:PAC2 family protein [Candidatus Woesearchaeota archaeon]